MIGTMHEGHRIIAAVPASHAGEYAVTAVRRQPTRHVAQYVTWLTDSKDNFYWGHYFTAHDQTNGELRDAALADMLCRAGYDRLSRIGA
jgi:hypothetical protein